MLTFIATSIAHLCGLVIAITALILVWSIRKRQIESEVMRARIEHLEVLDFMQIQYPTASGSELLHKARGRLLPGVIRCLEKADPSYEQWLIEQSDKRAG